jgi:hypothetical protein
MQVRLVRVLRILERLARVVSLSLQYPKLINAKFHYLVQCVDPEVVQSRFPEYFAFKSRIRDHLLYKYQLLIDGNSSSYSRAYWQLFSECTIFKIDSSYIQWYSSAFYPDEHYIPVKADAQDLVEKIQWAESHDERVEQIAQNAFRFAQDNLQYADILYYVYLLFLEYAKLQV